MSLSIDSFIYNNPFFKSTLYFGPYFENDPKIKLNGLPFVHSNIVSNNEEERETKTTVQTQIFTDNYRPIPLYNCKIIVVV